MADSSVTIRVRLTDDGQVKTSLRAVGEQGKAAADQIKSAMAGINFNAATQQANQLHAALTRMRQPLTMLQSAFANFAGNVFSQLASSLTQLPGLFNNVIEKTMEVTKEFADFAEQTGSTVEEISTFIGALGQFGVAFESVEGAMKKLSVTINDKWAEIVKDIEDGADKSRKTILAVEKATMDLAEAQLKAATSQKEANITAAQSQMRLAEIEKQQSREIQDRRNQEVKNTQSVKSARLGLFQAEVRLAELVSGGKLWPDEQRELDIAQAILDVQEKRQALLEARQRRERERRDEADRATQRELERQQAAIKAVQDRARAEQEAQRTAAALETAELARNEARDRQREAEKNSVQNLAAVVEDISAGREPSKDVNLSPENIVKGLIASVGRGAQELGKFGDSVDEIGAKAPDLFPVMMKMADFFKGLGNRALATATLTKLFGKAVSGNMVDAFMAGGDALKKFMAEQKKAGLAMTKEEADLAERFVLSRNRFNTNLEALKRKMTAEFGRFPSFDTFNNILTDNSQQIIGWSTTVAREINAASIAIGNLFKGISPEEFAKQSAGKEGFDPEFILKVQKWQRALEAIRRVLSDVSTAIGNMIQGISPEEFAKQQEGKMTPEDILRVQEWQKSLERITNAVTALSNALGLLLDIVTEAGRAGRAIGDLFGMGAAGEGLGVVLAIGLIIKGLTAIPGLVKKAATALAGLFVVGGATGGAAAGGGLLSLLRTAGKAGLAGLIGIAGGAAVFKTAELSIVDKYKQDLDELNAKFKDKSSAEYVAGLAKIRKEFLEDTKNLESFRSELGIPKSGALERLEKELGLLKKITDEKKKVIELDEIKVEGRRSDLPGGPGSVLASAVGTGAVVGQATMATNLFKAGIDATTRALQENLIAIDKTTDALISIRDQILVVVAVLEDFRRVLQKTIGPTQPAPGQEPKPAPGQEPKLRPGQEPKLRPAVPGEGPEPDAPPGPKTLDWIRRDKAGELSPYERERVRIDDAQMAPILEFTRTAPRTEEGTLTPEALRSLLRQYNPSGERIFPRGEGIDGGEERAADFRDTFTNATQQFSASVNQLVTAPRAAEAPGDISAVLASFKEAILACIAALEKFSASLAAVPRAAAPSRNINELIDLIKFATPRPEPTGGPIGGPGLRASGGMITGPGSGTSDSIMARLSNGEFVMSARAVGRYGAPFMHAINVGRFALGGLVDGLTSIMPPAMVPRFAAGGLARAGGGHTLNLTIDGNRFGGLGVPDRVAGRLERYAISNQVSSLGRKPSWRK